MNNSNQKNRSNKKNSFLVQGSILAIAGIIVRVIGMIKRIPLTNIIGDEGNGFYAAAYEVYNIILLISCYSLPLAVSKLVSARISKGQYKNANRIFRGALLFAIVVGGSLGAMVYFCSGFFAGTIMLEPMSMMALKVLGPTIFIVAIMGVLRGYFQGLGTMIPTAFSQVIEQIFVAGVSITAAFYLFDYGIKVGELRLNDSYGAAYGAAGGTMGTSVGAMIGLLFLAFVYVMYSGSVKRKIAKDNTRIKESYTMIFKVLLLTIVPVVLSTAVYHVSDIIDQRMFNQIMISNQMEDVKSVHWGIYSGKYKVLINIPIALASAMCASIIPTLIAANERGNHSEMRGKVTTVIRFTMILIIPCAVGLGILGKTIVGFLFDGDIEIAASLLAIGSISTVFYALSTLGNGILQGINQVKLPVRNALVALGIHIISLYLMLEYANLGIYGVVISTIIFSFLMCVFNYLSIKKHLKYKQEVIKTFLMPSISAGLMGIVIYLMNRFLIESLGQTITLFLTVIIGAMVYFIFLILLKGVSEKEVLRVPCGEIVINIMKKIGMLNKK